MDRRASGLIGWPVTRALPADQSGAISDGGAVIPRLRTEPQRGVRFDRAAYRERNRIERTINRLKQYRALATCYEKLAPAFDALVTIAVILWWL